MKVSFSARARRDLAEIGEWIARDDATRAANYVAKLEGACRGLVNFPLGYPVAGRRHGRDVRRRNFEAYRILYLVEGMNVVILAVQHGSRNSPKLN